MKTIYFECNMGAAGDMLMSALFEICPQKDLFLKKMNDAMSPFGICLSVESITKCGICGTHMKVLVAGEEESASALSQESKTEHMHSDYNSILERINTLPFAKEIKEDASAIYHLLGEAEAKVHGTTLEQIHFHEIGTLDALADIVGCAFLIHLIAPEQILASPVHVGNGFIQCAHGVLPVPAPATAELLKGIPSYSGTITGELCTPTGAAILRYYVTRFLPMPIFTTDAIGYGMGKKDFEIANCIRAFLGDTQSYLESEDESSLPCDDTILSVSCNIDDMTGEALGLATEILMAAGALDVYTIPIQMKKNRPGILLTCLCEEQDREKFTGLFFLHTSTRGVRYQSFKRAKLESTFETHSTSYGDIRVKRSTGYGIEKIKPEFEDLKSVVLKNGCSLADVTRSLQQNK